MRVWSREKVFPHNLRHLFATVFYRACRDIAKLADLLGHSNIETTRIYLVSSGVEHRQQIDRLGPGVIVTESTFCPTVDYIPEYIRRHYSRCENQKQGIFKI